MDDVARDVNGQLVLKNYEMVEYGTNQWKKRGISIQRITESMHKLTGDALCRGPEGLFVVNPREYTVWHLGDTDELFAFLHRECGVDWAKLTDGVTQSQFFKYLNHEIPAYSAIETQPHWPPLPGVKYVHRPYGPIQEDEDHPNPLDRLVDMFHPNEPADRELIKALFMTPFWGGPPGKKPTFLLTGPERDGKSFDDQKGRGIGKSILGQMVGELAGQYMDLPARMKSEAIAKRLLSPGARGVRVAIVDNVKTRRFSCEVLESLITGRMISGHRMFKGEGTLPNHLMCIVTMNGATTSKDIAQRSIPIQLARPPAEKMAGFERRVSSFIANNKVGILGSIRHLLEAPSAVHPADCSTRWSEWEQAVLCKLNAVKVLQDTIRIRQGEVDDDDIEREAATDFLRERLCDAAHTLDVDDLIIVVPLGLSASWISEFRNKPIGRDGSTQDWNLLGIPGWESARHYVRDDVVLKQVRVMRWKGPKVPPEHKKPDHVLSETNGQWMMGGTRQ
jgi:hypothetical protein